MDTDTVMYRLYMRMWYLGSFSSHIIHYTYFWCPDTHPCARIVAVLTSLLSFVTRYALCGERRAMKGSSMEPALHPPSSAAEEGALPIPRPLVKRDLTKDFTAIWDITALCPSYRWVSAECPPAMGFCVYIC